MKVPDLSRKTEDPLFLIRPVDLDMSWNPDSADAFSVVVFSDTGIQATERYVIEMGNLTGIFERPVLATDTVEPVAESFAGNAADPEPISYAILGPDDYDDAQILQIIRMWSGLEPEMITDEQLLASLGLDNDYPDANIPDWVMTELGVLAAKGDVTVDEFVLALQYVLENPDLILLVRVPNLLSGTSTATCCHSETM